MNQDNYDTESSSEESQAIIPPSEREIQERMLDQVDKLRAKQYKTIKTLKDIIARIKEEVNELMEQEGALPYRQLKECLKEMAMRREFLIAENKHYMGLKKLTIKYEDCYERRYGEKYRRYTIDSPVYISRYAPQAPELENVQILQQDLSDEDQLQ